MKTEILNILGTWINVANAARNTVGKPPIHSVSPKWIKKIIMAEHSPIRKIQINWKWTDIKYWVSVHFVKHKFGIEHFVRTQRDDRIDECKTPRDRVPQGSLINHECTANIQAIINISRKRLCTKASPETRKAWFLFLQELAKLEPEVVEACVPDCIYRGYCYEIDSCGYFKTKQYQEMLQLYRKGINDDM